MLRLFAPSTTRMCDGLHRREFMRIGSLGLGGLSMAQVIQAAQTTGRDRYVKDKAVIFLCLGGGPSQYETWDPNPDGPGTSKSIAGDIPTKLPGVRFASYFPKMAAKADQLSIVRSFQTHHAEHNGAHKQLMTADLSVKDGKPIKQPGLGAVYARAAGAMNPNGIPRHFMIPPTDRYLPGTSGFTGAYDSIVEGCQPAGLGPSFAPFEFRVPMGEGAGAPAKKKKAKKGVVENPLLEDLQPNMPVLQVDSRLGLLRELDRLNRSLDASGDMQGIDQYNRQALELLRGGTVRKALDLSLENPRTRAAYDTEHFRNYRCGDNSIFQRAGPSIGISLGRQLLMARRLCEAGCGFVTVIHSNWDFHARKGIPNMPEGMSVLAPPLDHAVGAFLEDVKQRGLEEKILLVITGEFGRTPSLDKNLGRHHWPRICPLVFAGGGLNHGQVIGESDKRGGEPNTEPYSIHDLHATIMHTMFDVGKMRLDTSVPQAVWARATGGKPIREMF